jgi:Tol biopolymer transport system component
MQAGVPRWSPDGKVIAFSARIAPDQPWKIYLMDSAGGAVRPACRGECVGMDLYWMPDGKRLIYSAPVVQFYAPEQYLRLIDVATGEVTKIPGSDGLHSPRVSPDGSMLAAVTIPDDAQLAILRFSDGVWRKLPGSAGQGWPSWSHDGTAIWYVHTGGEGIMRYLVRQDRKEKMLPLVFNEMTGAQVGSWFDLTPDDEPMILRRLDVQQIYSLELKTR